MLERPAPQSLLVAWVFVALLLIVAFIVVPLVELAVIIEVGQALGVLPTIAILLVDSILGGFLMRAQGRAAWRRLRDAMQAGRVPHREALDGALVIFGGALLLTPGFITDVVGLLLLIPPTRAVARRIAAGIIARRMVVAVADGPGFARGSGPDPSGPRRPYDVEGTASEANGRPADARRGRLRR
jgi:UPF0716 protein FxsA